MSSPSSSARRLPEHGRWDQVGTKLSLWPFKISIHSSCLSVIWICCMANNPILAWCSSSARSWYASSVVVPLKLRWDDKAGELFCLFTSFFTSNEGFLFELDECRHKRSANHQWQKTVAPQRAAGLNGELVCFLYWESRGSTAWRMRRKPSILTRNR